IRTLSDAIADLGALRAARYADLLGPKLGSHRAGPEDLRGVTVATRIATPCPYVGSAATSVSKIANGTGGQRPATLSQKEPAATPESGAPNPTPQVVNG
ncbi:MAG: hypothetical protein AAGF58_14510, partial [Pseudomonadota bacterium]